MAKELKPLTDANSALYLRQGYKRENLRISVAEMGEGVIIGVLDVRNPFRQPDGSYHLPSLDAYIFVSQLAIAYACHHFGRTKDELGQLVEHEQWKKSRRPIEKAEGIIATLDNIRLKQRGNTIIGSFDYDIEHGSVVGWMEGTLDASHPERYHALRQQRKELMFERAMAMAAAFYAAIGVPLYMTPEFNQVCEKIARGFFT